MGVTVSADDGRDFAGVVEVLGGEQVEIVVRAKHRVTADPTRGRAGGANMLHDLVFKIFDRRRRSQSVRFQSRQHCIGLHRVTPLSELSISFVPGRFGRRRAATIAMKTTTRPRLYL